MSTKRQIFYSFHFDNDVFRVQQIRNIGALEDNEPVSKNDWETLKRKGDSAIVNWIDKNMTNRSCVVVLIGEKTSERKWVLHEIKKAWKEGKTLLGIYIHNLNSMQDGKSPKGKNPFDEVKTNEGRILSSQVKCYDPKSADAYNDIRNNLEQWIEDSIKIKKN
jgi:hypothetical protein